MKAVFGIILAAAAYSLTGCTAATSPHSSDPYLRPKIVKGEYRALFNLANKVALQSFPDGQLSSNPEMGTITIIRRNYLRGDTQIRITFLKENDGSYSVNVSSGGFGSNPPIVDWSTGEVKKFMREFEVAYNRLQTEHSIDSTLPWHQTATRDKAEETPSKYEGFLEAVVIIRSSTGIGAGFFLTSDGHIITNRHVLSELDNQVSVRTYDGRNLMGKVVERADTCDLALVKIPADNYSWLKLAGKAEYGAGVEVLAIGMPEGLDWSMSKGIISAVRVFDHVSCIQTDTPINKGNSGGPLIATESGKVVGINTFGFRKDMAEGLNFAICSSEVTEAFPVVKALLK